VKMIHDRGLVLKIVPERLKLFGFLIRAAGDIPGPSVILRIWGEGLTAMVRWGGATMWSSLSLEVSHRNGNAGGKRCRLQRQSRSR